MQGNPSGMTLVIVSAGLNEFRTSMWSVLEKDEVLAPARELTDALTAIREHFDARDRFPDGFLLGVLDLYDPTDEAGQPPPGLDYLYHVVCSYYAAFSASGNLKLFNRHLARYVEQHGLCVEDPSRDRRAGALLQRSLGATELHLARRSKKSSRCDGWFEQRGSGVVFVLQGRTRLSRTVPWLGKARFALSRLAARQRLSSFSVLLLALMAEQRLGPLKSKSNRRLRRRAGAPTPAPAPTSAPTPAEQPEPASQPTTEPALASSPVPESQPVEDARRARRPRPLSKTKKTKTSTGPTIQKPGWLRRELVDQLGISLQVGSALRAGEMLTPLWVGAGLRFRAVVVEAGYQAPADWSLEGRDIRVQAVSLSAGWAPRLWTRGWFGLEGQLSMVGERVFLRRVGLERTEAQDHEFWDLGARVGVGAEIQLSRGFSTGVVVQGVFFPTSHEVRIPLGPGARLNVVSVRLGLRVAWGGRGNPSGKFL